MSEVLRPNNPYERPINATRPEGQMLVGEFYGTKATDKTLAGHNGRKVSSASRFVGKAIAVPVDMDAPNGPAVRQTKERKRKAATPSPEPTLPNSDASSPSDDAARVTDAITEDDLFG